MSLDYETMIPVEQVLFNRASALYASLSTVTFYLCFSNKNIKECGTNETEDA